MRARPLKHWWLSLILLVVVGRSASAEVLYLSDGDHFAGTLADSAEPGVISWQSRGAEQPFQFSTSAIRAAFFPAPKEPAPAKADYCFELTDGDAVFGKLISVSDEFVEIDSDRFGRLTVSRSHLRRLMPWHGSAAWEYTGPNALVEWQQSKEDQWSEEAGHLITESFNATLRKQVPVPEQGSVEVAISWTKKADFIFILSSGKKKREEHAGVHLEIWNDKLVIVRETETDADVASLIDLKQAKNRIHVRLLIDQAKGTVSVHTLSGAKLGEIQVDAGGDGPLQWISLRNHQGDVRFEQLVVSKWDGQLPPQVDVERERVHMTDGSVVYGRLQRYDADANEFIISQAPEDSSGTAIAEPDVVSIVSIPYGEPSADALRVGCHDGTRVSGRLVKVEQNRLQIKRAGVKDVLAFPVADVRCLIGPPATAEEAGDTSKWARLEADGMRSYGSLIDATASDSISCLVWQPRQSATSSPLRRDFSGRIVYRDSAVRTKPQRVVRAQPRAQGGVFGAVVRAFAGPAPQPAAPKAAPPPARISGYPHSLFLLAGDRIPCIVSHIDDRGVHFTSSVIESRMVPHEQMKALELVSRSAAASLEEEKRMRLLTLPRMQKNNPPTHLIASTRGDYLRARLQSMNGQTLTVETRLETKRLPRGSVANVIWLHPKKDDSPSAAADAPAGNPLRVQAVRADGVRLTFEPSELSDNSLIGSSPLLGACRVNLKEVDRILLGSEIREVSEQSFYDAWELTDAIEPQFAQDDGAAGEPAMAGLNSSLVGKPAPDFSLGLLDGGRFELSKEKGNIVVLDFWASWCAPCVQGMPEISRVVEEFPNEKIKYVAVNMQEDKAAVAGALERMQLSPLVALDIDGAAAERYEVSAIPQVVVIDREGNVARMFIGVNTSFADDLRRAIRQLTGAGDAAEVEASGS